MPGLVGARAESVTVVLRIHRELRRNTATAALFVAVCTIARVSLFSNARHSLRYDRFNLGWGLCHLSLYAVGDGAGTLYRACRGWTLRPMHLLIASLKPPKAVVPHNCPCIFQFGIPSNHSLPWPLQMRPLHSVHQPIEFIKLLLERDGGALQLSNPPVWTA